MKKPAITAACLLALTACSGNGKADSQTGKPVAQGPAAVAQKIVASHTGTDYKQVAVISVEAVDFSDSSLGCPQPEMAYLQVITPGHKIIAEVPGSDKQFDVRVAGGNGLICENKRSN